MKPPRVIVHKGYYYVKYYIPGQPHAVKHPVGVQADALKPSKEEITGDSELRYEWWKPNRSKKRVGSKHHKLIEDALREATRARDSYLAGEKHKPRRYVVSMSLEDLRERFLNDPVRILEDGKPTKSLIERSNSAIKSVLTFDPKASTLKFESAKWCGAFRDWGEQHYASEAFRSYANTLKRIIGWAIDNKLIRESHFLRMKTKVITRDRPKHIDIEDQIALFRAAWKTDADLFFQMCFERFAGYRMGDVCRIRIKDIDFKAEMIRGRNTKMKREVDDSPIGDVLNRVLAMMKEHGRFEAFDPFLLAYRTYDVVNDRMKGLCKEIGLPPMASRQLRRDFSKDIQRHTRNDRSSYALLLHHLPKGLDQMGIGHYSGADWDHLRDVLNSSLNDPWMGVLESLQTVPPHFILRDTLGRDQSYRAK